MDALEREFDATGECPTEPPERVVTAWGCPYAPELPDMSLANISLGLWRSLDTLTASINASFGDPPAEPCAEDTGSFGDTDPTLSFGAEVEGTTLPRWFTNGSDEGYGWLCLTSAPGPDGAAEEAAHQPAIGAAFSHREPDYVGLAPPTQARDSFVAFTEVDCRTEGEDVSPSWDCYYYCEDDCDGIDNDLDGVVDEGGDCER